MFKCENCGYIHESNEKNIKHKYFTYCKECYDQRVDFEGELSNYKIYYCENCNVMTSDIEDREEAVNCCPDCEEFENLTELVCNEDVTYICTSCDYEGHCYDPSESYVDIIACPICNEKMKSIKNEVKQEKTIIEFFKENLNRFVVPEYTPLGFENFYLNSLLFKDVDTARIIATVKNFEVIFAYLVDNKVLLSICERDDKLIGCYLSTKGPNTLITENGVVLFDQYPKKEEEKEEK